MAKKSLIAALAFGAGLAFAGNAYAQSNDNFYNRTGDFMLVSNYMNDLSRTKTTSMDDLLKGGNVTSIYAVDAIKGLKSRIEFLNSARGKSFYNDEERNLLIGRFNGFIAEISKEKRSSNYSKSLEQLSSAAKDGTISPNELLEVEDGTYMIVKEGTDKKVGKYSVLALVKLKGGKVYDEINGKKIILDYVGEVTKDKISDVIRKDITKVKIQDEKEKPAIKEEAKKTLWSLTFGVNSNSQFDNFGGSFGFRAYPFENKNVGLGIAGDVNFGLDKIVDSYKDELIDNLSAVGIVSETDNFSIGLSGEAQVGPILLGAGIDYDNKIIKKTAEILDGSDVIKSNSDSTSKKEIFGKIYVGAEIPITKAFGIGALVGYNWKDGLYFGIKNNIKLNK